MEMQVVTNTQSQGITNISKEGLMNWLQETLCPEMKDIGELGNGAAICLGMEILFPGTLSLKKVRVGGLSNYDKYQNFKYLQVIFDELGVVKHIPMDDLMRMSFKDNFYFGCWFKNFFEANYVGQPYCLAKLRSKCLLRTCIDCGTQEGYGQERSHYRFPEILTMKLRPDSPQSKRLRRERRKLHRRIIEKYQMNKKGNQTNKPSIRNVRPINVNGSESVNIIKEETKRTTCFHSTSKSYQALHSFSGPEKEKARHKKRFNSLSVTATDPKTQGLQFQPPMSPIMKDTVRRTQTGDTRNATNPKGIENNNVIFSQTLGTALEQVNKVLDAVVEFSNVKSQHLEKEPADKQKLANIKEE